MTEDQILISHARDLKMSCSDNSMITNTFFLDMRQVSLLKPLEREQREYVDSFYYGGYPDAERVCAVFVPKFFECDDIYKFFSEESDYNPISLIRIEKDRFSSLSHRDYLGSLMGLGIKREMLGDLLVDENGCFVPCIGSVAKYISENLSSVGRGTVKISVVSFDEIAERKENFKEISAFVASPRLDNIVSAAFSLSRTKSVQFIEKGAVFTNSVENLKPDYKVSVGDKIVLRGKGKAVVASFDGESKRGRLHITIRRYI